MPSTDWNKTWDKTYDWSQGGDEWTGQAEYCGQPYEEWKRALLETFVAPNLEPESVALEVAPGRGRWTEFLVQHAAKVHLFDLNESCIEACRQRFEGADHVTYCVNDGASLPGVADASVDFVWSYDSFVHMEADTIAAYLGEFSRVLRPGGRAVIHHAGRRHATLSLGFMLRLGAFSRYVYKLLSMKRDTMGRPDGKRSVVSRELFAQLASGAGLQVQSQVDSWGDQSQYTCKRFNDFVTSMQKPLAPSRA